MKEKRALRRRLLAATRALDAAQQRAAAVAACVRLVAVIDGVDARSIGAYWPLDGELDPRPALAQLRAAGRRILLPAIDGESLAFAEPAALEASALVAGPHGTLAPPGPTVAPDALDVVVVPAVGLDHLGARLGRGGGYYDRAFAAAGARPVRVGFVHHVQLVDRVPCAPHDVAVHVIVTDRETLRLAPTPPLG